MREIFIKAKGSSEPFYICCFTISDGNVAVKCNCRAGIIGQLCKHKINLIVGNDKFLFDPSDKNRLDEIAAIMKEFQVFDLLNKFISNGDIIEKLKYENQKIKKKIESHLCK